jgi:hypothetical protein
MSSSRDPFAVADAQMKIVKSDILSVVIIGTPCLSDDEGESIVWYPLSAGAVRVC